MNKLHLLFIVGLALWALVLVIFAVNISISDKAGLVDGDVSDFKSAPNTGQDAMLSGQGQQDQMHEEEQGEKDKRRVLSKGAGHRGEHAPPRTKKDYGTVAIVTYYDKSLAEMGDMAFGFNYGVYCQVHVYNCFACHDRTMYDRASNWEKLKCIRKYLYTYDVVMWVDADAYIFDITQRVEDWISLAEKEHPNANMILQHDPGDFDISLSGEREKSTQQHNVESNIDDDYYGYKGDINNFASISEMRNNLAVYKNKKGLKRMHEVELQRRRWREEARIKQREESEHALESDGEDDEEDEGPSGLYSIDPGVMVLHTDKHDKDRRAEYEEEEEERNGFTENVEELEESVYAVNSGVMIFRKTDWTMQYLNDLLQHRRYEQWYNGQKLEQYAIRASLHWNILHARENTHIVKSFYLNNNCDNLSACDSFVLHITNFAMTFKEDKLAKAIRVADELKKRYGRPLSMGPALNAIHYWNTYSSLDPV